MTSTRDKGKDMQRKGAWTIRPNGFYSAQNGNIRLFVEKVGSQFRIVVTRIFPDEMHPEEVLYADTAADAEAAMNTAERVAERVAGQSAPQPRRGGLTAFGAQSGPGQNRFAAAPGSP